MKILYHHRIASKDGQYVHVESIISALEALGHEIIIVAPSVGNDSDFGSDGGWVSKVRENMPQMFSELLEFGYSFYSFFKLCRAILKHKPDAIYERYNLFLPAGIWAKKLFKLPLQLEVNSPLCDERMKYGGLALPWLAKWSEYYAWRNADRVLPVTNVLAGYIKKAGVDEKQITVIHNGVDTEKFKSKDPTKRLEKYQGKLVVGFVGFCREWHKLDEVIKLLARHERKDLFFLLVGDGPVVDSLKVLADKLDFAERCEFTGLVARNDMPFWLDQIDIALQPAVTPWASPLKLIEYMAKGLAIIAPDTANIRELIVHRENGLLFNIDGSDSIIDALNVLLNDNLLMHSLANDAVKTIDKKQLKWKSNAEMIVSLFLVIGPRPCH